MRKKKNEQSLSDAIDQYLQAFGMTERMAEMDAIAAWEKQMGPVVAKHTTELRIRNGLVTIRVSSSALRQELNFSKDKIIQIMNEAAGRVVVREVKIC
jgi:predicted nucleic acid-binding Zn ribbon protein